MKTYSPSGKEEYNYDLTELKLLIPSLKYLPKTKAEI